MAAVLERTRSHTIWVPIDQVLANPLNPRKNDAIKTEEMQSIILKRGWEEPLTVYKKGRFYIVLAGHRRLFSAKEAGVKEIPLFVVDPPENHQEEIERIASLQRGRVDWTAFEWARFTYERWVAWGRPTYAEFSKQVNIPATSVRDYISVMTFYNRAEIEAGLDTGTFTMKSLVLLRQWFFKLKATYPKLVMSMTDDMVRKMLLTKLSNKYVTNESLKRIELFEHVSEEDVLNFLRTPNKNLQILIEENNIQKPDRSLNGYLISIGRLSKNITDIQVEGTEDIEKIIAKLEETQTLIKTKIKRLKKQIS